MYLYKILFVIQILIFLFFSACSEKNDSVTSSQNILSYDEVIGTWLLVEINYPSNGNTVTVTPSNIGLSMTLKFFDTKSGQIISIENGSARVDDFYWNISGSVVEIIDDEGKWESLRCNFSEGKLCIEYGFEPSEGNLVLASFVFEKDL